MPDPAFKLRTVTRPDGSRLTAGWIEGKSDVETLSDEEFLAMFDTWRDEQNTRPNLRIVPDA